MALGFLATKARSDVLTLSLPAELVPGLLGALDHLASPARATLAAHLEGGGPVTARRDLLSELLRVAIDDSGDQVALAGTRLLRGEGSAADLRSRMAQLGGLLDLLDVVEG